MDAPNLEGVPNDGSLRTAHRFSTPLVSILGPALGGAFLIPHPWIGALLWLGLFENLRFAAFALFGTVLAVFAGLFLYLGASDLVPESHHAHPKFLTTVMTIAGAALAYGVNLITL